MTVVIPFKNGNSSTRIRKHRIVDAFGVVIPFKNGNSSTSSSKSFRGRWTMTRVVIPFKNGNSSTRWSKLFTEAQKYMLGRNSLQKRKFFNNIYALETESVLWTSRNSLQKRKFFNMNNFGGARWSLKVICRNSLQKRKFFNEVKIDFERLELTIPSRNSLQKRKFFNYLREVERWKLKKVSVVIPFKNGNSSTK